MDTTLDGAKRTNIGNLKEFYLQRLARTEPNAAARPAAKACKDSMPQVGRTQAARPTFSAHAPADIEDLEVMCNNCFNLIKSSEAASCTGHPTDCPIAQRSGGGCGAKPSGPVDMCDLKLTKLRVALMARLEGADSKVNVMRHLTQLRYHIDTASKWTVGCSEIGAVSDHTVQQIKQLTATSRVLAPAVYIFSKRIENVVVQKERELRRALSQSSQTKSYGTGSTTLGPYDLDGSRADRESVADVNSIVSELDSDCGTQYAETAVTQDSQALDVGNVNDANEYLSLKNEDEQRRWFYAQTLTVKLSLADKTKARKTLISDLYAKVREEGVPIDQWVPWIRRRLMPEDDADAPRGAAAGSPTACPSPSAPLAAASLTSSVQLSAASLTPSAPLAAASLTSSVQLSAASLTPSAPQAAASLTPSAPLAAASLTPAKLNVLDRTVPVPAAIAPGASAALPTLNEAFAGRVVAPGATSVAAQEAFPGRVVAAGAPSGVAKAYSPPVRYRQLAPSQGVATTSFRV